jgi:hypothetical protein
MHMEIDRDAILSYPCYICQSDFRQLADSDGFYQPDPFLALSQSTLVHKIGLEIDFPI